MSTIDENPSFIGDDIGFVKSLLNRLLQRRRSLVPWPLTPQETPLLWWPSESYDLLHKLKLLGNYDQAFESRYSILLDLPPSGSSGFSELIIMATSGMPVFDKPIKGLSGDGFKPTATGVVAEKFDDWFRKARVIHSWNLIAENVLESMTTETRSWRQLRKAFPEMYDLLAKIEEDPNSSWKHSFGGRRVMILLQHFKRQGHAGAHDTLPDELKQIIRERKAPLIAVLKQALEIPPSKEGLLDDGIFQKTWFQ